MLLQLSALMLGGAMGALCRFGVTTLAQQYWGKSFPYGILMANMLGSFAIGFLVVLFMSRSDVNPALKLGLMTGFLGAFTTFSSFSLDSLMLFESGELLKTLLNVVLNVSGALIAVWLGTLLARAVIS